MMRVDGLRIARYIRTDILKGDGFGGRVQAIVV